MTPLERAIRKLLLWQMKETLAGRPLRRRALYAVRRALRPHLELPRSDIGLTVLECLAILKESPEKWGWQEVPKEYDGRYALAFFTDVGTIIDNKPSGHIAIIDKYMWLHFSSVTYPLDSKWLAKLDSLFIPVVK